MVVKSIVFGYIRSCILNKMTTITTPLCAGYHGSEIGTVTKVLPGQLFHVELPTGATFYLRPHVPIADLLLTKIVKGWRFDGTVNGKVVTFFVHDDGLDNDTIELMYGESAREMGMTASQLAEMMGDGSVGPSLLYSPQTSFDGKEVMTVTDGCGFKFVIDGKVGGEEVQLTILVIPEGADTETLTFVKPTLTQE